MNKAVCYLRVGPLELEEHAQATEDQLALLAGYCAAISLDPILTIRDERVIGAVALDRRLGGQDMLRVVDSGGVEHVVVWRLDRLFRTASETLRYMAMWSEKGVVLHVIDLDGLSIRTDSESGQVVLKTVTALSNMEPKLYAERTKTDIALKKSHGFVYGVTPYGYDSDGSQLSANDFEQEIIERVKTWRTAGWSLRRIADELNGAGVPTKRSLWRGKPTKWYASTVRYVLANGLYADKAP